MISENIKSDPLIEKLSYLLYSISAILLLGLILHYFTEIQFSDSVLNYITKCFSFSFIISMVLLILKYLEIAFSKSQQITEEEKMRKKESAFRTRNSIFNELNKLQSYEKRILFEYFDKMEEGVTYDLRYRSDHLMASVERLAEKKILIKDDLKSTNFREHYLLPTFIQRHLLKVYPEFREFIHHRLTNDRPLI